VAGQTQPPLDEFAALVRKAQGCCRAAEEAAQDEDEQIEETKRALEEMLAARRSRKLPTLNETIIKLGVECGWSPGELAMAMRGAASYDEVRDTKELQAAKREARRRIDDLEDYVDDMDRAIHAAARGASPESLPLLVHALIAQAPAGDPLRLVKSVRDSLLSGLPISRRRRRDSRLRLRRCA
jgi:hypothetical protein